MIQTVEDFKALVETVEEGLCPSFSYEPNIGIS